MHLQPENVDQIKVVEGVRPTEVFVVAQENARPSRKHCAVNVESFAADQVGLVPGEGPFNRLVRVDGEHGSAVGGFGAVERKGIGAVGGRFAVETAIDHAAERTRTFGKRRHGKHEAGEHIALFNREAALHAHLIGMGGSVGVDALAVAVNVAQVFI